MESEKDIERYLCEMVRRLDGEAYKFVSPMRRFVLDRMCVLPNGLVWFVEVKSEGQKPNLGQMREIERLKAKGHRAVWVDSVAGVNKIVHQMREEIENARCGNYNRSVKKYIEPCPEDNLSEEE